MIELGAEFISFAEFKTAVANWSIAAKFPYRIYKSDKSRVSIKCRVPTCPFSIYAVLHCSSEVVHVTSIVPDHTCIGSTQFMRAAASRLDWLVKNLPSIMVVDNDTKPKAIIQAVQHNFQECISPDMASRAKHTLIRSGLSSQKLQFAQFPKYLRLLEQRNPDTYAHLALNPLNNSFQRIFVCPPTSIETFSNCRPFVALDGTFTKTHFVQVLLLAVGIDAENHATLLAWAMVESETEESWRYFLVHLRQAIPAVNSVGVTIMSDRDKGLQSADSELPLAFRGYCNQHLKDNVQRRYGVQARYHFTELCGARTKDNFTKRLAEIHNYNSDLAQYIEKIDRTKWAAPFFPGRTYGHHTSNIAESVNSSLQDERRLPCLELLDRIWHKHMDLRFRRREEGVSLGLLPGTRFTKYAQGFLRGKSISFSHSV